MSAPNSPKSTPNSHPSAPRTQNVLLVVAALVILILVVLLVRPMLSQPKSPQGTEPTRATEQPKSRKPTTLTGKWEVVSDVGHSAFEYIVGPSKVGDELEFMTDGTLRMQSEALSYSIPEKGRLKIDVGMGLSGVYDYQIADGQLTLNDGSEVFTLKPYKEVEPTSASLTGAWSMADISDVYMPGQPCLGFGSFDIDEASLLEFDTNGALYAMTKTGPVVGTFVVSGNALSASLPKEEQRECRVKLTEALLRIYNKDSGADEFRAFTRAPEKVGLIAAAVPTATPIPTATPTPRPIPFVGMWEVEGGAWGCPELFGLPGTRYEFTQAGGAKLDYPGGVYGDFNPSLRVTGDHQVEFTSRGFGKRIYDWTSDGNTLVFTDPSNQSGPGCRLYRPLPLTPSYDTLQKAWHTVFQAPYGLRGMDLVLSSDGTVEIGGSGLDRQTGTYKLQGESLTVLFDNPIQMSADTASRELTFVIKELTRNRLVLTHDEAVIRVLGTDARPKESDNPTITFLPD